MSRAPIPIFSRLAALVPNASQPVSVRRGDSDVVGWCRGRVSDRAKEFVRRCLAYQQSDRPDVLAVFQDPYLRHTGRQASTAGT